MLTQCCALVAEHIKPKKKEYPERLSQQRAVWAVREPAGRRWGAVQGAASLSGGGQTGVRASAAPLTLQPKVGKHTW